MRTTIEIPIPKADKPKILAPISSHLGGACTIFFLIVLCLISFEYSLGRSSFNVSKDMLPVNITGSIGNTPGRKWVLKKWIVKIKPAARRASSLWIIVATLTNQPGSLKILVKSSGNHSKRPLKPITGIPQKTAI